MFGSAILDVATGLIFIFLLLSLVCSAANELLELLLKKRAKDLELGIKELIGDPENATKFIDAVYNHGLVNGLFRGTYGECKTLKLPSYIPSRNFALAAIEIYQKSVAERATQASRSEQDRSPVQELPKNIVTAFATLEATAQGDAAKLQVSVEDWFDSAMDRVAGWYKRRTQTIILFMGIIVAIGLNADSIDIAQRLSRDQSLRQGIVALADAAGKKDPTKDDKIKSIDVIKDDIKTLDGLGLAIGWPPRTNENQNQPWYVSLMYALEHHSFGWLITSLAISLGAPFWFDMLNKIIVVRSTVKPKEKSKDEKSKS